MSKLILAKGTVTGYRILIAKNASETEKTCAKILRSYLKKITGADFPVCKDNLLPIPFEICVGKTNRLDSKTVLSKLYEEGYLIRINDNALFLCGGGDRGTLYAVYSFLELLGVRYYTPTCEKIPRAENLAFELDREIRFSPIVDFRDENWRIAWNAGWCEKQKINSTHDRELPIAGGTGYFGWFVHTMGDLAEMTPPFMNKQPCLTDETVFQTVLKNVRKRFVDFPGNSIISVSQNDGTEADKVCQCENCRAINEREGTLMGTTLYMANRVADAIRDEHPDVLVDTLSYNFTCVAPKYMKPRDNVVIRFVTAFCCIHHALEDAKDAPGAGSEKKSLQFNENLIRWSEMAKTLHMWYYTTSFSNYLTPLPNFEAFRRDMRYLTDHKVRGFFLQGNATESGEFGELRAYLAAKLLWNPRMKKQEYYAHMDDFLNGYYGKAGGVIRQYIDLLLKTNPDTHFHLYADPLQIYPPKFIKKNGKTVLDTTFLDQGNALWDKAEALVKDTPSLLRRVQKARLQQRFYEINLRFSVLDSFPENKKELQELKKLNQKLYRDLRRFKITHLTEGMAVRDNPNFENTPLQWYSKN